jgi:sterol desaturase/sphingolipid hydroxylase (fatty acid hydroxylase superfamily)
MVQPRLHHTQTPEVVLSLLLSVAVLSAVYLVVGALERVPSLRFRRLTSPRPYLATDIGWYGVAVAATAVSVFLFRPVLSRSAIEPIANRVDDLPFAAMLLLGLVIFDLVSFAVHVGLHRSDTLWNVHKVHHSTLELDGFATTRAHMFENLVRFVPGQLVLFLIGMPATVVAPTVAIAAIYGVSNHSNLDLEARWIEALLVTPRLHRRHHVPASTHSNFGAVFTIWDRAFGSLLRCDTTDDERYGVPGEIDTYPQHFRQAFRQPIVQIRDLRQARRERRDADAIAAFLRLRDAEATGSNPAHPDRSQVTP